MTARDSLFVQAAGPTGMLDVEESRVGLGSLWIPGSSAVNAKSGFRPSPASSPGVVTASGTPDAFVHVAPFQLVLQTSRATVGGAYIMTLDAQFDVNILSTPADPTNPRNDLVIAQQSDTFYGDGVSTWTIRQVVGTPSGSPADPTVSGSTDYVPLARVRVNANATTITGANITDLRTSGHAKSLVGGLSTVAIGGILPVQSQAERDAVPGKYPAQVFARNDLVPVRFDYWDGSGYELFYPWQSAGGTLYWPGPRGLLGGAARTSNSAGITTTETLIDSVTITAVAGRRYKVNWDGIVTNNAAGNNTEVRLRWANAGTVTSAGTLIKGTVLTFAANENHPVSLTRDFTGFAAGTLTVGAFLVVSFGGGTATSPASATWPATLLVEDIGT